MLPKFTNHIVQNILKLNIINFEASHSSLTSSIYNNIYWAFVIKFLKIIFFQQKHKQTLPVGFASKYLPETNQ